MEFSVKANKDVLEFIGESPVVTKEEKEDIDELVDNMAYGCAKVIYTVLDMCVEDIDMRKKLTNRAIMLIDSVLEEKLSEEHFLGDKMEEMYQEWFENECSYEKEKDLIEGVKSYTPVLCLVYNDDEKVISVYLKPDDESLSDGFCVKLGAISLELYKTDRDAAKATLHRFECIAAVLFDKAVGKKNNPIRDCYRRSLDKLVSDFLADNNLV